MIVHTKVSKKKRCQEILNRGTILEEDKPFLTELIKSHPEYELKEGKGISYFFIKRTQWGNNGFYIKRIDNSETDFSYIQCLLPRTHLQEIKCACRYAIAEDTMNIARRGYIAHHEIPFIDIFNLWIKNKDIEKLELNDTEDNCVIIKFKDENISKDFRMFHNTIAKIKEITPKEHKEIHRGKNGNTK